MSDTMTPELADLARRAMALEGAPSLPPLYRVPMYPVEGGAVWFLTRTGLPGGVLGGVLLRALGDHVLEVTRHTGKTWSVLYRRPDGEIRRSGCHANLAEACCRVALTLGRWPGPA